MQLYEHQKKIVDQNPKKCGLWLGTGSGKTRTALALARGKVLVICPKTQRDDENWQREAVKMNLDIEMKVISKEEFRRDHEKMIKDKEVYDTIIVDEAHTVLGVTPNTHYKNRKRRPKASQLFYALMLYTKFCNPERLYLVTATIVKSPITVWGAGVILGKVTFSLDTFERFRDIYYIRLPMTGREVYAPRKDKETKERLARFVNKLGPVGKLSDYFDVPEQTFKDEHIELTTAQRKAIADVKLDYPDPIVAIGKRHQVENGVLAGDEWSDEQFFKENKTAKIVDYSYEFPRMIVFVKYTQQINMYKKALEKEGKKVFTLTGKTKDRGALLEEVNNCGDYVFICQAQISAGWEVPDCPVMIFASRTYSFVDFDQAKGRILRANHLKKNLYINLIVKGGIDEAVHESLLNKQDFSEKVYAESNE